MSVNARLKKLESSIEIHDCPVCHGKGNPLVIVTLAGEEPDLSETYCKTCGAGPAVEKYVEVHPCELDGKLELARAKALFEGKTPPPT